MPLMARRRVDTAPRSRRPPSVGEIGGISADGIPYLAAEIQLFYEAKRSRPKDEIDSLAVLPVLSAERRRWLSEALYACPAHIPGKQGHLAR
jgi:hypothetical protein